MSQEVLYRKYRPYTFDEVIGQGHVVDTLISQAASQNPSHAYLFFGGRGIGKTSIARIFGRELGISDIDVYEIDAASNRGIDDIRDLREAVKMLPFESTYKLYIIDEVHMLTKEAFNALLKTLEEPPKHVIFILATTEIEKVPETIVSRCQVYTLKRPTEEILAQHIVSIAKKEGYSIHQDDAFRIARTGDGSFRDTLGNLQKVLYTTNQKDIQPEHIETILELPRKVLINDFIVALVHKKHDALSVILQDLEKENFNIQFFIKEVIIIFRQLLLARFIHKKDAEKLLTAEARTLLESIEKEPSTVIQSKTLSRLIESYLESRNAFIKTLPLELAVVDILEY